MKGLCDQSSLKWGPFPPNEVSRIAHHLRKGEERKEGRNVKDKNSVSLVYPLLQQTSALSFHYGGNRLLCSLHTKQWLYEQAGKELHFVVCGDTLTGT